MFFEFSFASNHARFTQHMPYFPTGSAEERAIFKRAVRMNSKEGQGDIEEAPQYVEMKIKEVKLKIQDWENFVSLQHDINTRMC